MPLENSYKRSEPSWTRFKITVTRELVILEIVPGSGSSLRCMSTAKVERPHLMSVLSLFTIERKSRGGRIAGMFALLVVSKLNSLLPSLPFPLFGVCVCVCICNTRESENYLVFRSKWHHLFSYGRWYNAGFLLNYLKTLSVLNFFYLYWKKDNSLCFHTASSLS